MSKKENTKTKSTKELMKEPPVTSPKLKRQGSTLQEDPLQPTSLLPLVNQQTFADVIFNVALPPPKEKQREPIYAHSWLLEFRAPDFYAPLAFTGKKKKNILEVDINGIPPVYLVETLNFIYTGKLEYDHLSLFNIMDFLSGLKQFEDKMLDRLKWHLQNKLRTSTTLENIHQLLKYATNIKLEPAKKFFLHFACENYDAVVSNKQGVTDLGIDLFQEVVAAQATFKSGDLKKEDLGAQGPDTYADDMKRLYSAMKNPDIAFKLVDPNFLGIGGTVLRAHKGIFSAASPELAELVQKPPVTTKKGEEPTIALKGITTEGFAALLKYLYYGEKEIPFIAATELVIFCKVYRLPHLQKFALEGLKKEINADTVLTILNLSRQKKMPEFFKEEMRKLRPKCLRFIAENLPKIDLKQIAEKKMHHSVAPDVLLAIQKRERREDPNFAPKSAPASAEGGSSSSGSSQPQKWASVSVQRSQQPRRAFLTRAKEGEESEEEEEDYEEEK